MCQASLRHKTGPIGSLVNFRLLTVLFFFFLAFVFYPLPGPRLENLLHVSVEVVPVLVEELDVLVVAHPGSRRYEMPDDNVLLEPPEGVRRSGDGRVGKHPGGFLEGGGG